MSKRQLKVDSLFYSTSAASFKKPLVPDIGSGCDSNVSCAMDVDYSPSSASELVPDSTKLSHTAPGHSDIASSRLDGPSQVMLSQYPTTIFGGVHRAFSSNWYKIHPWLEYSRTCDRVFCFPCRFFCPPGRTSEKVFVELGYGKWKAATGSDGGLKKHERSTVHQESMTAWCEFKTRCESGTSVKQALSEAHQKLIQENREYLCVVAEAVRFAGIQKIALRGHREGDESSNRGTFVELMHLLGHHSSVVEKKLKSKSGKYTHHSIQNEMLQVMANLIRGQIVNEIQETKYFSVIIDETKDLSKSEQLSLCVRYFYHDEVHEEFLGLLKATCLDAESLLNYTLSLLNALKIDLSFCVAQCYDGASVMTGCFNGVQARFREKHPQAIYIHCFAHSLNLAIIDCATAVPQSEDFFEVLRKAHKFISSSVIHAQFLREQEICLPKERRRELKSLSQTRWSSQFEACDAFTKTFPAIIRTLTWTTENRSGSQALKALSLLSAIRSAGFLICLLTFHKILGETKGLSKMLQSPDLDLASAANIVETVRERLAEISDNWDSIWTECAEFGRQFEIKCVGSAPKRLRSIPERFGVVTEGEAELVQSTMNEASQLWQTKSDYFLHFFHPTMKVILEEFEKRFSTVNQAIMRGISCILPTSPNFLQNVEDLMMVAQHYSVDTDGLTVEMDQLRRTIARSGAQLSSLRDLAQFLKPYQLVFHTIWNLTIISLSIPISSASCERTFSTLRLVKNYLRTTMSDARLDSLITLGIHCARASSLSLDLVVDSFVRKHDNRRILLF